MPEPKRRIQRVALVGPGLDDWRSLLHSAGLAVSNENPDLVLLSNPDEATLAQWRDQGAGWPTHVPLASTGDHAAWSKWHSVLPDRRLIGLHLTGERLVQFAHEPGVEPSLRDAVAAWVRRVGKVCVPCAPVPGFIVERLHAAAAPFGGAATPEGRRAMAHAGGELLTQGVAVQADDIDVAMVTGGGFPAILGGPLFHASAQAG